MANRVGNVRGQESRAKLLSAGLSALHVGGFAATGVDVVAKAAGVPKGSFYNHFGSKEAFGAEVVDLYFERHLDKLRSFFSDDALPPLDRLKAYLDERTAFFASLGCRRGCMMGNLSLEAADHSDLLRAHLAEHFGSWSGIFASCIREAQARGQVRAEADAALLADFLLNSWEGALLRMKAERSTKPLADFKTVVFGTVLS